MIGYLLSLALLLNNFLVSITSVTFEALPASSIRYNTIKKFHSQTLVNLGIKSPSWNFQLHISTFEVAEMYRNMLKCTILRKVRFWNPTITLSWYSKPSKFCLENCKICRSIPGAYYVRMYCACKRQVAGNVDWPIGLIERNIHQHVDIEGARFASKCDNIALFSCFKQSIPKTENKWCNHLDRSLPSEASIKPLLI